MSKYLQKYISTLPDTNRNRMSVLLNDSIETDKVISVGEYNAWYNSIKKTLDKTFEPTTSLIEAESRELIHSIILNYLAESVVFDLSSIFTEINALFNFINLNKLQNNRLYTQLHNQVFALLSEYENYISMRQHGSEWSKGIYTLFNAGTSLFLPYGYLLKDNIYVDYDGSILSPLQIVNDADEIPTTGKLILDGETTIIGLTEPELLWEPPVIAPDFTLQTGTDINNSIDNNPTTHWVNIMCYNKPAIVNETPIATPIKYANKSDRYSGNISVIGFNETNKPREYFIKFINKGELGTAKYVCSDDGVNYTDLICVHDIGTQCKYGYAEFYTKQCRNPVCARYKQIGCVTTSVSESVPIFNSHNEDTGLAVQFDNSGGFFYPGDIWKITCPCNSLYGARLRYSVKTKCNSLSNHLSINPVSDKPFIIDSIQYYDATRHYYEQEGIEPKYLTSSPIYVNAPIRIDFTPRNITQLIINMRQENYTCQQYNVNTKAVDTNLLTQNMLDGKIDSVDTEIIQNICYNQFSNSALRDLVCTKPFDPILKRDVYCYTFGLADVILGLTSYSTHGRSILKNIHANKVGKIALHVNESTFNYELTTNTVSPYYTSTEYDLFIKNYNLQGGWVSSIELPILPHIRYTTNISIETSTIKQEHLRLTSGVGKLRFYSTNINKIYSVYNNKVLTVDDYTIIQQTDVHPYCTYIDLSNYLESEETSTNNLFIVSYTPQTNIYLDSGLKALLDTDNCVSLNFYSSYPSIASSDIYLLITQRRNTFDTHVTPSIHKIQLLAAEVDEYKFYPEGDISEESGTILYTASSSVK